MTGRADGDSAGTLRTAAVMAAIEGDVRGRLRRRLVQQGVAAYGDADVFEHVRALLERAADERNLDALLLPELFDDGVEWELEPNLRLSSHRPVIGRAVLFAKRRVLLPLTRWLFEYSQANFRRQQRINRILVACIEELAIDNARLRQQLRDRR